MRQCESILGFIGHAAEIDARIPIGEVLVRYRQRFIEALVLGLVDLDAVPRLLRKQSCELDPCRLGRGWPVRKNGIAPPQALPRNSLALRKSAAVDRRDPQGARRLAAIRTLAHHPKSEMVRTDSEFRSLCSMRQ